MQFQCPKCSGVVSIDETNLGKTVACGHCKEVVNAPGSRFAKGVIINDFIIEKELGVGGMGVVYLAKQITLDRYVALKILKEKYAQDSEFVIQFVREACSAAKLNHPNVGEENGIFFFAMEYVDGKTMKEELAEKKKIKPETAAKVIRDIAVALDYAWNESKIVHHDIKPDNIMLTKNGKAKLADLGLASKFGDSEVDDSGDEVLGTPQDISPEQLLGEPTDVRSDIYSLGATFYHLVTGTFAYLGDTPTEIAHKHVNGVFEPPIERESSVPQVVSDIISKMMAKDINLRYQSADEVADDLKKYLDNSGFVSTASVPVQTVPASAPPKAVPPQGGLKLSLGGANYPPAPAPAAIKTEPAKSAPETSVSAPAVKIAGQSKPSAAVPKVNLGGSKSPVSVPKVNLGGAAANVPKVNLNKTTPAVPAGSAPAAVPQLGLKKDEPEAPAAPEKTSEKTAEKTPGKEEKMQEKKSEGNEEKTAKSKKTKEKKTDGKKKKAPKTEGKAKIPAWLIVIVVVILLAGGGIAFYMYKNKWKAPVIDKIKTWNAERKAAAKKIVYRVPVAPKKELSIEEQRKDYIPTVENLKKSAAQGREFLKKVDKFIAEQGTPELEKEKAPFAELLALYNAADEKVFMASGRAARRREHENAIRKRISDREASIRQAKQIEENLRKAEEKRRADELAEQQRLAQANEAANRKQAVLAAYQSKIAHFYPELAKMFYEAIFSGEKETEFKNKLNNLFVECNPVGDELEVFSKLDDYARKLQKEIPYARKMYKYMTENTGRFAGGSLFKYRDDMVEIRSVNFPKQQIKYKRMGGTRDRNISLKNNDAVLKSILAHLEKKLPKEKNELKKLPFYYNLFFGDKQKAASAAPSAVWKEFFKYYR